MKKLICYITDKQLTAEIVSIFSNAVNMHIKGWQSNIIHINDFLKNGMLSQREYSILIFCFCMSFVIVAILFL